MSLGVDFTGYVKELLEEDVPPELATSLVLEGYRTNILLFERLAGFIAARGAFLQSAMLVAAAGNESQRNVRPDFVVSAGPPAMANGFVSVAYVAGQYRTTPNEVIAAAGSAVGCAC